MDNLNIKYIQIDKITKIKTIEYTQMTIKIVNHNIGDNCAVIQINIYDSILENMKIFINIQINGIWFMIWLIKV